MKGLFMVLSVILTLSAFVSSQVPNEAQTVRYDEDIWQIATIRYVNNLGMSYTDFCKDCACNISLRDPETGEYVVENQPMRNIGDSKFAYTAKATELDRNINYQMIAYCCSPSHNLTGQSGCGPDPSIVRVVDDSTPSETVSASSGGLLGDIGSAISSAFNYLLGSIVGLLNSLLDYKFIVGFSIRDVLNLMFDSIIKPFMPIMRQIFGFFVNLALFVISLITNPVQTFSDVILPGIYSMFAAVVSVFVMAFLMTEVFIMMYCIIHSDDDEPIATIGAIISVNVSVMMYVFGLFYALAVGLIGILKSLVDFVAMVRAMLHSPIS